MSVPTDFSDK